MAQFGGLTSYPDPRIFELYNRVKGVSLATYNTIIYLTRETTIPDKGVYAAKFGWIGLSS